MNTASSMNTQQTSYGGALNASGMAPANQMGTMQTQMKPAFGGLSAAAQGSLSDQIQLLLQQSSLESISTSISSLGLSLGTTGTSLVTSSIAGAGQQGITGGTMQIPGSSAASMLLPGQLGVPGAAGAGLEQGVGAAAGASAGLAGTPLQAQQASQAAHNQLLNLSDLYKTQQCKHFAATGQCSKGNNCHFAHGKEEQRRREDPLPPELMMKMMRVPYSNIKTQLCKYWLQEGKCQYKQKCSYAHGEDELRNQYDPLPDMAQNMQTQSVTNSGGSEDPRNALNVSNSRINGASANTSPTGQNNLRMILTNPRDEFTCNKILESNMHLKQGRQQMAYEVIQELLNLKKIYFELTPQTRTSQQSTSGVGSTQPQTLTPNVTPISSQQAITPDFANTPIQNTGGSMQRPFHKAPDFNQRTNMYTPSASSQLEGGSISDSALSGDFSRTHSMEQNHEHRICKTIIDDLGLDDEEEEPRVGPRSYTNDSPSNGGLMHPTDGAHQSAFGVSANHQMNYQEEMSSPSIFSKNGHYFMSNI